MAKGAYILDDSCRSLEKSYKEYEELIKEKKRIISDQEKEIQKLKSTFNDMDRNIESERAR